MRSRKPPAGPLRLLHVGDDGGSAIRFAMADLIHELYFKKPHFPGNKRAFTRVEHDRANAALRVPVTAVSLNHDPVSEMLSYAASLALQSGATATREELLDTWEKSESPLNARCRALLGLLGPERAATLVRRLLPNLVQPTRLWVADLSSRYEGKRSDGKFGQPDLLLDGDNCTVLVEMKVRGKKAHACYDPKQLLDYLILAAALRRAGSCAEPIVHIVLAPKLATGLFSQGKRWLSEVPRAGGLLKIDSDGFAGTLRSMTRRRRPIPEERIATAIEQLPLTPIIYLGLESLLSEVEPLLVHLGAWESMARQQHGRLRALAVQA